MSELPAEQIGFLLSAVKDNIGSGDRVAWRKVVVAFNERFGTKYKSEALRAHWRRVTGDPNSMGLPGDPDVLTRAELAGEGEKTSESILEDAVAPLFPGLKVPDFDWEAWYAAADQMAQLTNRAQPTILAAKVHLPTDRPIALMNAGDWHIGSRFMAFKTFRALMDLVIATPRLYFGLYGDEADNFPLNWMAPALTQVITPNMQWRLVRSIASKLMDEGKVLFSFWGNHNFFSERMGAEDPGELTWVGRVPYFRGKGVVRLLVGSTEETAEEYIVFGAHEFKGSSIYNPNHPQMRALLWEVPSADLVVAGHTHNYSYQEIAHHDLSYLTGLHRSRTAHLLQIGSSKNGPDAYTLRGWSQGQFEWPVMVLDPHRHIVKRIFELKDLEYHLDVKLDKHLLGELERAAEQEGGFNP